ncbi:peptidase M50 [Methanomicrobiaceae archaeon CYW5]|uniref:site-2 protease family protein n=1 Tax=Methanovulcanius yangii TaxID=1789227 RepID=UPI0029CA493B|nr:site-2 protease family protein [Methanovulcanius yangii]MBT8507197.1 peptidase M50 [Methanovulcanius yangii]
MDWLVVAIFSIAVYALIAGYIKYNNLWKEHITFYGPILALKTDRVGFFDKFRSYSGFLRIYGTFGAILVVVISVIMSLILILGFYQTIQSPPAPEGIYEIQNILAIPGVNEFIPLTIAVLIGLFLTMVVHEFGHAILCRVEDIRVKSTGILFVVVPFGAFVEPDEEDVEKASRRSKIRMYGAGIVNNLVVAGICLVILILLLGMATPNSVPMIYGVYKDYPAEISGVPPDSVITAINGVSVESVNEIGSILKKTAPGEKIMMEVAYQGETFTYPMALAEWPEDLNPGASSGFMGISYYTPSATKEVFEQYVISPVGPLFLLYLPINYVLEGDSLQMGILAFDTSYAAVWDVPFKGYWGVVQIVFWTFWFNLAVGTFNALPFIPLDGGYIMQEGVTGIFERRGRGDLAHYIVTAISTAMIVLIVLLFAVPHILG